MGRVALLLFLFVLTKPVLAEPGKFWFGVVQSKHGYEKTPLGYIIDMVKLGLTKHGIDFDYKEIPFNRARLMASKGKGADVYLCTERYDHDGTSLFRCITVFEPKRGS